MRLAPLLSRTFLFSTLLGWPLCSVALELDNTSLLETQFDTNLVNSPNDNEPLFSPVVKASHNVGATLLESTNKRLKAETELSATMPTRYVDLISADGRIILNGTWQPTSGFTRPWYNLALGSQWHWSNFKQHQWGALSLNLTRAQRLNDRLYFDAALNTEYRHGHQAAFDGFRSDATLYESYQITPRWSLYASQKFGYGQLVTSYHGALMSKSHHLPDEELNAGADSISDLYFLDRGLTDMLGEDWYTYGLPGYYADAMIGANGRLTSRLVLDLAYRFHTEIGEDVQYNRNLIYATLIYPW